jgi:hypothetical protein
MNSTERQLTSASDCRQAEDGNISDELLVDSRIHRLPDKTNTLQQILKAYALQLFHNS